MRLRGFLPGEEEIAKPEALVSLVRIGGQRFGLFEFFLSPLIRFHRDVGPPHPDQWFRIFWEMCVSAFE